MNYSTHIAKIMAEYTKDPYLIGKLRDYKNYDSSNDGGHGLKRMSTYYESIANN